MIGQDQLVTIALASRRPRRSPHTSPRKDPQTWPNPGRCVSVGKVLARVKPTRADFRLEQIGRHLMDVRSPCGPRHV